MSQIDYSLTSYKRPKLTTPNGEKKLLLHSCCAPCAGEVMEALVASDIDTTIFFYNPNIHPNEAIIDADYDREEWFERTKGQENAPERGERCTTCFDMRFEKTAQYASDNEFDLISSTLGISRWKDMDQINASGERSSAPYNIPYWNFNWRKKGGSSRMLEISKKESFYRQEYCGCVYSLRDTNRWRVSKGREKIRRGIKFYREVKLEVSQDS